MKIRHLTAGLITGLAAGAVALAPIALAPIASAANPSTTIQTERTTTTDKRGHNAIVVHPPTVSAPNSYGQFGPRPPIILFD